MDGNQANSSAEMPPIIPEKKQKPLLTIGLMAFPMLLLGVTGYFAYQNSQLKKQIAQLQAKPKVVSLPTPIIQTSSPTPSRIADWLSYKTDAFEFKYPTDWEVELSDKKVFVCSPVWREGLPEGGMCLSVEERKISLREFIDEYNKESGPFVTPGIGEQDLEDYDLNGALATKLTASTALGVDLNYIFTTKNGVSYIITFHDFDEVHLDILSTFQLLEQ